MGLYVLGQVVQRPISPNPELNFNLGFLLFFSKAFSHIIFSILYRASNHCISGKKNLTKFSFLAFKPELKLGTNPDLS